jgi:hypothetical protein
MNITVVVCIWREASPKVFNVKLEYERKGYLLSSVASVGCWSCVSDSLSVSSKEMLFQKLNLRFIQYFVLKSFHADWNYFSVS